MIRLASGARWVFVVVAASAAVAQAPVPERDRASAPEIESWAPGAFDGGACAVAGDARATYQVDATVLMPLLIAAMPIASRSDVGIATFSGYDCKGPDGRPLRAYEFFARSFPERARGLNRLGFLREAIRLSGGQAEATAQAGVITANQEESLEDARRVADSVPGSQPYSLITGVVGRAGATNAVTRTALAGEWMSAQDLYQTVRPIWLTETPTYVRRVENERQQAYAVPVGFLGSLQISLREVAAAAAGTRVRARPTTAYVHNGRVYHLIVTDVALDQGRARQYTEAGLLAPGSRVWRVEYRIVNDQRKEVETFRLFTELPTTATGSAAPAPVVPLAFGFRPRSFLELRATRIAK